MVTKPLTKESLKGIRLSFATCSIGCKDEHTLPVKLDAIAAAGFQAIELSMPDIVDFANLHSRNEKLDLPKVNDHSWDELVTAAGVIKAMCGAKKLKVLMLQPFANFEGWPEGTQEHKDAWERARGWRRIMEAVGTDMLQVGSTDSPLEKIHQDKIVKDLAELADFLAEKNFRICYENWCWSSHAPGWSDVWNVCEKVNRPNFGLCLDTFQSAGGEWADPTTASGLREDQSRQQIEKDWKASCDALASTVPADKIYLLQISDAYKPERPIPTHEVDGLRPRGQWSHDFRPLPYDGYLPVEDFTKAVLETGFRGWFSYEVFDSGSDGKGKTYDLTEYLDTARQRQDRLLAAVAV